MPNAKANQQDKVIAGLMELLAERGWGHISLADVAVRADMPLGDLRAAFPSIGAILGAYIKRIDLEVLKDDSSDLADQPVRERLFDLLMRRLDAMSAQRDAMRRLRSGLRGDPLSAKEWNKLSVTSHQWTLAAAGVTETGFSGAAKAQVLACAFSAVLDVWVDDDEPDQARTMRELDEQLNRLERLADAARGFHQLTAPLRAFCRPGQAAKRPVPGEELSEANAI